MRYLIYLFIFLFNSSMLLAETEKFTCIKATSLSAAEAKARLQKTQEAYSKVNTLKADFTQESYLSALETSETSTGVLNYSKPGKMKWEYATPEEQIFLIIDTTLWFYQALDKQVVIDKFEKFLITDLPVAFILGIGDLSKSFEIENACSTEKGKSTLFSLIPKDKKVKKADSDERLDKFELIVSNESYLPKAAKIFDVAANTNAFYLENTKFNEEIPEAVYKAEFPDGTDIDDRRSEP